MPHYRLLQSCKLVYGEVAMRVLKYVYANAIINLSGTCKSFT